MFFVNRVLHGVKEMISGKAVSSVPLKPSVMPAMPMIDSEPVILHVYSISDRLNRFSLMLGLGLYHTAVEVYGREHAFVGHPFKFTGIVSTVPKSAAYIYQEGLDMGRTKMSEQAIDTCLKDLGKIFSGSSYHLLYNNCNHFASELVKRLCNGTPPAYINRAANSVCCLPFLDSMFSAKTESERFFVEVLYLTFNGDIDSVMNVLEVDPQTALLRYVSYIEAAFEDHSIPKCLPYYPVVKSENPFTPAASTLELVKEHLSANFIFAQSQYVYDLAFEMHEEIKMRASNTNLAENVKMTAPDPTIDNDPLTLDDYSMDIHRHLNRLQETLIHTVGQPASEHFIDRRHLHPSK